MKIKITRTDTTLGIKKGAIFDNNTFTNEEMMAFVDQGLAEELQNGEENQSLTDDWGPNAYPNRMLVLKDGNMYRANVGDGNFTSTSWIYSEIEGEPSEWTRKIQGI